MGIYIEKIATRATGVDTIWNRKRSYFQSFLSRDCIYSTHNGAWRIAEKLSSKHIGVAFTVKEEAAQLVIYKALL